MPVPHTLDEDRLPSLVRQRTSVTFPPAILPLPAQLLFFALFGSFRCVVLLAASPHHAVTLATLFTYRGISSAALVVPYVLTCLCAAFFSAHLAGPLDRRTRIRLAGLQWAIFAPVAVLASGEGLFPNFEHLPEALVLPVVAASLQALAVDLLAPAKAAATIMSPLISPMPLSKLEIGFTSLSPPITPARRL
jgi:hypothetical protein